MVQLDPGVERSERHHPTPSFRGVHLWSSVSGWPWAEAEGPPGWWGVVDRNQMPATWRLCLGCPTPWEAGLREA